MKRIFFLVCIAITVAACNERPAEPVVPKAPIVAAEDATCSGDNSYCNACKNCRYCKHCSKDGGTCKVCK